MPFHLNLFELKISELDAQQLLFAATSSNKVDWEKWRVYFFPSRFSDPPALLLSSSVFASMNI